MVQEEVEEILASHLIGAKSPAVSAILSMVRVSPLEIKARTIDANFVVVNFVVPIYLEQGEFPPFQLSDERHV